MRNSSLILLLCICIFSFQQTLALRRIKRGSTATQNKTKLSNDVLQDFHNISNDITLGEHVTKNSDGHEALKEHSGGTWAKKAVAAVEQAIDKAFSSLSHHKSDKENIKKNAPQNINPLPLHHTTNNAPQNPSDSQAAASGKDQHKPSLAYMLGNSLNAERLFGNMQHDAEFSAGNGPAEVLIIDNGMQPMMGMQHALNSYAFHQPNLRNIANSFKRLAELSKESKLNNLNALKLNAEHSNSNSNLNIVGKHNNNNGISEGNEHKGADAMLSHNKRNDNQNNGSTGSSTDSSSRTVGNHNRNNDHITSTSNEMKYNGNNNNNNDALIVEKSQQNSCVQQQQLHEQHSEVGRESSFPALLSLAHQAIASIGASSKLQEHSQAIQQQQQRMKHDKVEKSAVENGHLSPHAQPSTQAETRQQYSQFVKHTNGKVLPMESFLKFANMMLYKVGPDGTPIHAQGAQLAMNGNPTASVISISPSLDRAEDAETIDYIYNSLDPQLNLLRNPALPPFPLSTPVVGAGNNALISRPFIVPPYSLEGPAQPFNLIENALDMFLGKEDEGNDEMEIFCPIHHPKKKSSESAGDAKDKDDVIQVCSCRFFKKNKNA